MTSYRSIGEMYLSALENVQQNENPETLQELLHASEAMEEYTLFHITAICRLMEHVTEEIQPEEVVNIGAVINELAVFTHRAFETRNHMLSKTSKEVPT